MTGDNAPPAPQGRRIHRLADQVANQIAAGEVVERPASVVKELVENAVDAGATRVEVYLKDGGREAIRIVDNGSGIRAEDVVLAFERHATSKIVAAADLQRVASYGFRGEALASIASVARIECKTRRRADELGTRVVGDGTGHLDCTPVSCAAGTDLTVHDLFARVPARREFLRTAATELGHVIRLLDQLALARLPLHLELHHNGRPVSEHRPASTLRGRAVSVLGADVAHHLFDVAGDGPYEVSGVLSAPSLNRGTSAGLTLIVDGRPVADKTLVHAIRTAYGDRLSDRRYPVGVLVLRCPPATVDVNVHPSKTEVRFLSKHAVHAAVVAAVGAALDQKAWLGAADASLPPTRKPARPSGGGPSGKRRSYITDLFDPPTLSPTTASAAPAANARPQRAGALSDVGVRNVRVSGEVAANGGSSPVSAAPHTAAVDSAATITLVAAMHPSLPAPLSAHFVACVRDRWLVFDTAEGLVLVDRSAAAQTAIVAGGGTATTRLMIPLRVSLGPPLVDALKPALRRLARRGIEVVAAPGGGVLIRTAPVGMQAPQIDGLIRHIAGSLVALAAGASSTAIHACIDRAIAKHVAPGSGAQLNAAAVLRIVVGIDGCALPLRAADGRPAILVASWGSMAAVVEGTHTSTAAALSRSEP